MTEDEIVRMTHEVLVTSFEIEPDLLKADSNLFEDLGLDSLDTVDLVVALQQKFDVKIRSDERVKAIRTLGDIYRFIGTLRAEGQAAGE